MSGRGVPRAPAACFRYSPDRKGVQTQEHLAAFRGFMHHAGIGLRLPRRNQYADWRKLMAARPQSADPPGGKIGTAYMSELFSITAMV